MADFPAVAAALSTEAARLASIELALVGWINALLQMPQRDGAPRQTEGSNPVRGAAEIMAVDFELAGDRAGHDNIRERVVIASYRVAVRYNGTLDETSRRAARCAGALAWAALDASAPPSFADQRAMILPSESSSWGLDPESAQGRSIGGAFTVRVMLPLRVAE